MSYLKINDPVKRDKIVQDFISRKNRIKENFKREREQELNAAMAQEKYFEPVIASQAQTTKALKQLQDSVVQNYTPLQAITDGVINLDEDTQDALAGLEPGAYNVKWDGNRHIIGTKPISFNDGKIIFDNEEYSAAKGLLSLLTRKTPIGYDDNDLANYANILDNSGAIYQSKHGPKDKNSDKWKRIVRPIWEQLYPRRAKLADSKKAKRGNGIVYLSSDPNALVERLELLISSAKAGNTGVRNEIVSILDELLRMKIITRDYYKSILV